MEQWKDGTMEQWKDGRAEWWNTWNDGNFKMPNIKSQSYFKL